MLWEDQNKKCKFIIIFFLKWRPFFPKRFKKLLSIDIIFNFVEEMYHWVFGVDSNFVFLHYIFLRSPTRHPNQIVQATESHALPVLRQSLQIFHKFYNLSCSCHSARWRKLKTIGAIFFHIPYQYSIFLYFIF